MISYILSATSYQLHPISYILSATSYQLHPISYILSATSYQLHPISYILSATSYQLHPVSYILSATSYQLHPVSYILSVTSYRLHPISYILSDTSYQLHHISYILSATSYQLHLISYILSVTSYQLHPISYILSTTSNQLYPISYILSATSYQLHPISYILSVTSYQLHHISYILSATSYQLHSISYILSSIKYILSATSIKNTQTLGFGKFLPDQNIYHDKHITVYNDKLIWQLLIIVTNVSCYTLYKLTSPKYTFNDSSELSGTGKCNTNSREFIVKNSCRDTTADRDLVYSCIPVYTQYTYTLDERASEPSAAELVCCTKYTSRPCIHNSGYTPNETDSYSRQPTTACATNMKTSDNALSLSSDNFANSDSETYFRPYTTQDLSPRAVNPPITQNHFVLAYTQSGLLSPLESVKQEPRDGESEGKTAAKEPSSSSTGSTNAHSSRATARSGLQRNYSGYIAGESEDDDGDRDRRHQRSSKIKSQCETELPLEITPIKTKHNQSRVEISINQEDVDSSTVFGRLSKQLMETFSNMTLFGAQSNQHETSGDMDSTFNLNITIASVSQLDQTQTPEQQKTGESNWPTPIIHITPAKEPLDRPGKLTNSPSVDDNTQGDCYFTGRGNPVITPVNRQRNQLLLPRSCKARVRSRSVSSNRPYRIPPAEAIKKKLRLRVDSQLMDGTPVRKRSPSESDINFVESFEIPRNEISCIQIHDEGYHDCSAGREYLIHLKHDFFHAESRMSRPALITALENALTNCQRTSSSTINGEEANGLQRTVTIDWDPCQVEELLNQLNECNAENNEVLCVHEDPLLYLLARMIQHQKGIKTSTTDILYNSLKITSIMGRGQKVVLNKAATSAEEPLVVLHMGKERAMNIIPKRLNLAMLDVFDVQLGNFSVISISNKTTDSMHISLPKEKSLEDDDLDLHILVELQVQLGRGNPREVERDNDDPRHNANEGHGTYDNINTGEAVEKDESKDHHTKLTAQPCSKIEIYKQSTEPSTHLSMRTHLSGAKAVAKTDSNALTGTDDKVESPADLKSPTQGSGCDNTPNNDTNDPTENKEREPSPECKDFQPPNDKDTDQSDHLKAGDTSDCINNEDDRKEGDHLTTDITESSAQSKPAGSNNNKTDQSVVHIKHPLGADQLQEREDQKHLFLSAKSSVLIANGVKNKKLKNWLKVLKLKPKANDRAFEHREVILEYVQDIMEQKVVPPPKFIRSFIEQLVDEAIDDEMSYQHIKTPDSQTSMGKKKKMIKDKVLYQHYPNLVHNSDIICHEPISSLSLFKKSKDEPVGKRKTTSDTPALHSPTTSPSPSGEESDWNNSSKETRKKCKTKKKKKKKELDTAAEPKIQDAIHKEGEEKVNAAQKKDTNVLSKGKAASLEVEPPNRFSHLERALEHLEKRVIDLDLEQVTLKECIKKEITSQKNCLDLLLEEDKENKRPALQQVEKALNKQINPILARIQALEATTCSLKDGFELQTQNMEKIVEEIRTLRQQTDENKKGMTRLQTQLEKLMERQRDITDQLNNTKPPKTRSTITDDAVPTDTGVSNSNENLNLTCMCSRTKPKVASAGSQTDIISCYQLSSKSEGRSHSSQVSIPAASGHSNTHNPEIANRKNHHRSERNQPRAPSNSNETRSLANMTTMTTSANGTIHPSRLLQVNSPLADDVPTWALNPQAHTTNEKTEPVHHQPEKTNPGLGSQADEKLSSSQPNAVNKEHKAHSLRRRKCLLVHDSTLAGFDANKFPRTFDVTLYPAGSCNSLNKDKRFEDRLRALSPECIFIHLGTQDILGQRTPKRIAESFKELIWYLLENTEAQLCFSLIIPTKNGNSLNTRIREFNELLTKLISDARAAKDVHKSCLFSYSNNSVEHHNIFNQGIHEIRLTEIGKRIMWSRLSDGFNKALRLPRRQLSGTNNNGRQARIPRHSNNQTRSNHE